jgi:hypothetical protein
LFLRIAPLALALAAGVALALTLLDKAIAPRLESLAPWYVWAFAPLVLGLLVSVTIAAFTRVTPLHAAACADAALGFKDRLASALELARQPGNPFSAWAIAQSEALASGVDPRRVVPLPRSRAWLAVPLLIALGVISHEYVPARAAQSTRESELARKRDATREQLRTIAAAITPVPSSVHPEAPAARPEELRALEDLQHELSEKRIDPDDARIAAARQIEQAADRLDRADATKAQDLDRAREALSNAARSPETREDAAIRDSGSAASRDMIESLRRGDLGAAAEAVRRLDQEASAMLPEQREAMARQLEDLANKTQEAEKSTPSAKQPVASPAPQDPSNSPEPSQTPRDEPNQPESSHSPPAPEKPSAPQTGQQAESPQQTQPQHDSSTPAAETPKSPPPAARKDSTNTLDRLREAMRDAARQLRPDSAPDPQSTKREPTSTRQDSNRPSDQRNPEAPPPAPGSAAPSPQDQPAETKPKSNPGTPSTNPTGESPDEQTPTPQPHAEQEGTTSETQGPSTQRDAQHPTGKEMPDPSALGRIEKILRDAVAAPKDAERQSQRLRDLARRLQEQSTPEQQQELQRLAQQIARDTRKDGASPPDQSSAHGSQAGDQPQPDPAQRASESASPPPDAARDAQDRGQHPSGTPDGDSSSPSTSEGDSRTGSAPGSSTHGVRPALLDGTPSSPRASSDRTVDARSTARPAHERVIAEWTTSAPRDLSGRSTIAPSEQVRQAAEAADRAIEQQTIPPRYSDLVRRVFKRYSEQAATPDARPVPPAKP